MNCIQSWYDIFFRISIPNSNDIQLEWGPLDWLLLECNGIKKWILK